MSVESILAFIVAREQALGNQVYGEEDPLEDLGEHVPEGRVLPGHYRAYLERLGQDSGGFKLIPRGASDYMSVWMHLCQNTAGYPEARYLKIGVTEGEPWQIVHDWFLDLERTTPEGDDAPVVRFEDDGSPEGFRPSPSFDTHRSFHEMLLHRALMHYSLQTEARGERKDWLFPARDRGQAPHIAIEAISAALERMGLGAALLTLPELWGGDGGPGGCAALLYSPPHSPFVRVRLSAPNRRALEALSEPIIDAFELWST